MTNSISEIRIDVFLDKSRLVKSRSIAKTACENGAVKINGRIAKASCKIEVGDIIEIESVSLYKRVEVSGIPKKNLKKQDAILLYKVLEENKKEVFKDD